MKLIHVARYEVETEEIVAKEYNRQFYYITSIVVVYDQDEVLLNFKNCIFYFLIIIICWNLCNSSETYFQIFNSFE